MWIFKNCVGIRPWASHFLFLMLATGQLFLSVAAYAQSDQDEVAAAFVLNFVRFSTWTAPGTIEIAVLEDSNLTRVLSHVFQGKQVQGKSVEILATGEVGLKALSPEVVVWRWDEKRPHEDLQNQLMVSKSLTVTIGRETHSAGSVIHLFEEDGKLRFGVDSKTLSTRGLHLSSQLLRLAKWVDE